MWRAIRPLLYLLLGRGWFPSQRSLARFSHPDPRWPGLIDAAHFCLVAVSTHAGVEEKLFGLAIAPHHYLLHGAGCHVQTHVTSLAQHKRKETSFLRSLSEGLILHLQNLAEVLVQLTKQANIVSREPGQPGCRQPNASYTPRRVGPPINVDARALASGRATPTRCCSAEHGSYARGASASQHALHDRCPQR